MDALVGLFLLYLGYRFITGLFGSGDSDSQTPTLQKFETKAIETKLKIEPEQKGEPYELDVFEIYAKGQIPVPGNKINSIMVTHLLDETGGDLRPVLCFFEGTQEEGTRCYEDRISVGEISYGDGYLDWVKIATAFKDSLIFPRSRVRSLLFQTTIIPANDPQKFYGGAPIPNSGTYFETVSSRINFYFQGPGYDDQKENREKVITLTIRLAMHVGSVDGSLDDDEVRVVKEWAKKILFEESDSIREEKEEAHNKVIREEYNRAKRDDLLVEKIIKKFNEIATTPEKYDALELCLDVMAGDSVADQAELKTLDEIATGFGIDSDKYHALRDRRLAEVSVIGDIFYSDPKNLDNDHLKSLLEIKKEWDQETIRKHLNRLYRKWNSRTSSSDEKTKEKAKDMLSYIGEGRLRFVGK